MVRLAVLGDALEVERGWTHPDGIETHALDVVELAGERPPCPAAVPPVGGVARCVLCRGSEAVGDDSVATWLARREEGRRETYWYIERGRHSSFVAALTEVRRARRSRRVWRDVIVSQVKWVSREARTNVSSLSWTTGIREVEVEVEVMDGQRLRRMRRKGEKSSDALVNQ